MNALRPRWEILARNPNHSIFQSFEWNHLAARTFAARQSPFVVMAESDSGVAIIPACVDNQQKRISLLGEELFDYRDILRAGDPILVERAWEVVVNFAAEYALGFGFHSLRVGEDATVWCGLPLLPFTSAPCAYAKDSPQSHPHLEVNFKRLSRLGVTREQYLGRDTQVLKHVYTLKAGEPGSLFRDPTRIFMLLSMTQSAGEDCEIFTLESGGTLIAALVTFRDKQWRRFYTTYFDRSWAKHSPGSTLLNLVMRESLSSGLDCDLMTGDQPYKRRMANHSVPLYRVSVCANELAESRANTVAA